MGSQFEMTPRTAILALLVLAGCSGDRIPVDRETVAAHELVGFDWCSPEQLHQCALIRHGGELLQMGHPSRIGDGAGLGGDVWDVRGATVDAFSEVE